MEKLTLLSMEVKFTALFWVDLATFYKISQRSHTSMGALYKLFFDQPISSLSFSLL